MSGFGTSPTTGTQSGLPANQIPIGSVAVPGTSGGNLTALEGGPASTDANGNQTAPVSVYIKDGGSITIGTQADAAWAGSGSGSEIAVLKKIAGNQTGPYYIQGQSGTPLAQSANGSGLTLTNLLAHALYASISGGPLSQSAGIPQGASADLPELLTGKSYAGTASNITTTVAGDTQLVFGSAPKSLYPGCSISLSTGLNAVPVETVLVSQSYVLSNTATTIPLQYPVVTASSTCARWDVYATSGPGSATFSPSGILPIISVLQDVNNLGFFSLPTAATADGMSTRFIPAHGSGTYNGTTYERQRSNLDNISLVASAAHTTTQTSADQINYSGRGVIVVLNVTSAGTGSITLEIDGKDPISSAYYPLLTGTAVTTNSTNVYQLYPGVTPATNAAVSSPLPRTWRTRVTANNANSMTYSVGASVIL